MKSSAQWIFLRQQMPLTGHLTLHLLRSYYLRDVLNTECLKTTTAPDWSLTSFTQPVCLLCPTPCLAVLRQCLPLSLTTLVELSTTTADVPPIFSLFVGHTHCFLTLPRMHFYLFCMGKIYLFFISHLNVTTKKAIVVAQPGQISK